MKKDEIECVWGSWESVVNKGWKWKNTINTKTNKKGNLYFIADLFPNVKLNMRRRINFYESKMTTLKPISKVSFLPHRSMRIEEQLSGDRITSLDIHLKLFCKFIWVILNHNFLTSYWVNFSKMYMVYFTLNQVN